MSAHFFKLVRASALETEYDLICIASNLSPIAESITESDESFALDPDLTHVASEGSLTESDESIVPDVPPLFQEGTKEQESLKMVYSDGNLLFTSTGQFVSVIYFDIGICS